MATNLWKRTAICAAVMMMSAAVMQSRPKSLGVVQSFRGFMVSYEHFRSEDCFISAETGVLMTEMFLGQMKTPGFTAGLGWNFVFFRKDIDEYAFLRLYAGPGLAAGYSTDFRNRGQYGPFFGICGRLGVECEFARGLTLSAGITPSLGAHVVILNESVKMTLYKNGLVYGLVPEIGIKYNF